MGGRKVTIVFDEDAYNRLEKEAQKNGLGRVSVLARYIIAQGMSKAEDTVTDENNKSIVVKVTNYRELAAYVSEKKLGDVSIFAAFAMEQHMQRVPLTAAQKERFEKTIG